MVPPNFRSFRAGATFALIGFSVVGCGSDSDAGTSSPSFKIGISQANKSAQIELTRGIVPAAVKTRFRRKLAPLAENTPPNPDPPYDLRGTPEATQRAAIEAKVQESLLDSDWPIAAPTGTERVIYTDLENLEEFEHEFPSDEIQRGLAEAVERGVNHASVDGEIPDEVEDPFPGCLRKHGRTARMTVSKRPSTRHILSGNGPSVILAP